MRRDARGAVREKILKIVVELSKVPNVAARARRDDREVVSRQAFGDFVHASRMTGRAVDHDCDLLRVAISRRIESKGEGRTVAGLEVG